MVRRSQGVCAGHPDIVQSIFGRYTGGMAAHLALVATADQELDPSIRSDIVEAVRAELRRKGHTSVEVADFTEWQAEARPPSAPADEYGYKARVRV